MQCITLALWQGARFTQRRSADPGAVRAVPGWPAGSLIGQEICHALRAAVTWGLGSAALPGADGLRMSSLVCDDLPIPRSLRARLELDRWIAGDFGHARSRGDGASGPDGPRPMAHAREASMDPSSSAHLSEHSKQRETKAMAGCNHPLSLGCFSSAPHAQHAQRAQPGGTDIPVCTARNTTGTQELQARAAGPAGPTGSAGSQDRA